MFIIEKEEKKQVKKMRRTTIGTPDVNGRANKNGHFCVRQ
jgi:hypothetical protein